jgi:hypothetical protein
MATASLIASVLALIVAGIAVYLALRQTKASEATAKIEQSRRDEEIAQAKHAKSADVTVAKWTPRATSTRRSEFATPRRRQHRMCSSYSFVPTTAGPQDRE